MAERVDVSRLSVAECMALGGGAGEPAKEEGLQGKLEKLVQEIGLEVDGVDRHLHTGLRSRPRSTCHGWTRMAGVGMHEKQEA